VVARSTPLRSPHYARSCDGYLGLRSMARRQEPRPDSPRDRVYAARFQMQDVYKSTRVVRKGAAAEVLAREKSQRSPVPTWSPSTHHLNYLRACDPPSIQSSGHLGSVMVGVRAKVRECNEERCRHMLCARSALVSARAKQQCGLQGS